MSVRNLWGGVFPRVFLDNDDGGSGGGDGGGSGGDGGGDGDAEPKTFTEEEVQQKLDMLMKKHRRGLQRDLKVKDKALADAQKRQEETEAKLNDLEEQISAATATSTGGGDGDDPEMKGQITLLTKKYERELETLKKQVSQETEARQVAEQKARETKRDTLLLNALSKAKCIDSEGGYRYFIPMVIWDALDEEFRLRLPDGGEVSIEEGVVSQMPDYLKPSASQDGGAGTRTGSPTRRQKQSELDRERKQLEQFALDVKNHPSNHGLTQRWMRQRNKVRTLEQELELVK